MLEALTGKLEGGRPVVSVTVGARAPESDVADLLRETEAAIRASRSAAIRSSRMAVYGANFVIGPPTRSWPEPRARTCRERLREAGFEPIEGGI